MAPVKISNLKAFEIYQKINGPSRRKEARGRSTNEVDLEFSREILHECGIQLIPFENDVSFFYSKHSDKRRKFSDSCTKSCSNYQKTANLLTFICPRNVSQKNVLQFIPNQTSAQIR